MNEPRRLRDEAESPLEEALLDAGRSYGVSSTSHRRTLMALGLAGSATVSATASGLSALGEKALHVLQLGPIKWLAAASIVAAPAAYWGVSSIQKPTPDVVQTSSSNPTPPIPSAAPQALPDLPSAESKDVQEDPGDAPGPARAENGANNRGARGSRPASLSKELQALDAARSELARGDARAALSALDAYARAFPRGRLQLEAEVLRIDALSRSGLPDLARRRAEAFLRRAPNSVLASRVRRYVND